MFSNLFNSFSVLHVLLCFAKALVVVAILPCSIGYFTRSQILSCLYSNKNGVLVLQFFSDVVSKRTLHNSNTLFWQFPVLDTCSFVSHFPFWIVGGLPNTLFYKPLLLNNNCVIKYFWLFQDTGYPLLT